MKKIWTLAVCTAFCWNVQAQQIESVLRQIEQNNKELQAQQQLTDAAKMEVSTQNYLNDPNVSYSPFFQKGTDGVVSSEMVVSMGFDFPTLYVGRQKAGRLQKEMLDRQLRTVRRDVLLKAKGLCLELVYLNKVHEQLQARQKNAEELLALFEKRLEEGDANALDVNKIKMERMNVQTEVARNNAAHRAALQQLLAMNGNLPLEGDLTDYPSVEGIRDYNQLYDEVMATDASLQTADAAVRAAEKNVSVSRQQWIPKIELGYRRNTSLDEKFHGMLIGGSIPIFSNRKKVKIAKAQAIGAQLNYQNARLQTEAVIQGQFNEIQQLKEAMEAYDVPLMHETLDMLKEAVTVGQLSVITYYVEADNVYKNLAAYMEVERQYQQLMADVYKNRL